MTAPSPPTASAALGYDERRAARDRASLFSAAGLSWPAALDPEAVHARKTDYPFSVDVSNNVVLGALDASGRLRRAVAADGIEDVRGRAIPGVYIHKQLSFWQGCIDLGVFAATTDGERGLDPSEGSLEFRDRVTPAFRQRGHGIEVLREVFAPAGDPAPAEIRALLTLINDTDQERAVTVRPQIDARPVHELPPLNPVVVLVGENGASTGGELAVRLAPGARHRVGAVIRLDRDPAGQHHPSAPSVEDIARSREESVTSHVGSLGTLDVPEDPWFGELLTRASELARQSMLLLPDGTAAGSFWGSNANPLPDVWTRDFGYSALGLLDSQPRLAGRAIDFLAQYGLPERPWEREAEINPEATGLQHSLGNACLAIVLSALFLQRHGRQALDDATTHVIEHARQLGEALLAERPGHMGLYRTLYISDGPSRGDFHIGSNILAWRAAKALADDFSDALGTVVADDLRALAEELHEAISARGVRVVDGEQMFVEGIYADGQFVRAHDGEESDLTLASVYGFVPRDDHRVRAHARWAESPRDPYYSRITGGVDFWDWDDYNGVTYPGHVHMLSTAATRAELAAALRTIRETTDLDGSFWWWPFKHAETEPSRIKRGLGKCGWCAGEFVSFMVHDVLGVTRDHDARTLTFAPYTPWQRFSWTGLQFCGGSIDLCADDTSVTVTNRTSDALTITLQVCLRPGDMIEDVTLNAENCRYQSEIVSSYDSAAVRATATVAPDATATLAVRTTS
ncbi:hypothetical protein [Brachybacterium sp. NPDC056505]|uniref:hypothetical protein n=1 Tax=Brachybacterium sp. NPDC056505 TaxID=3345843 RepID=UPI00366C75C4